MKYKVILIVVIVIVVLAVSYFIYNNYKKNDVIQNPAQAMIPKGNATITPISGLVSNK